MPMVKLIMKENRVFVKEIYKDVPLVVAGKNCDAECEKMYVFFIFITGQNYYSFIYADILTSFLYPNALFHYSTSFHVQKGHLFLTHIGVEATF